MAVTAAPSATCGGLGGGTTAASQLSRSLERLLEEAALSGELRLSGRKLRELPRRARELCDTVRADLSKNILCELPEELTTYVYMERLLLAHNAIRHIPETVAALQSLTYLDLSGNQLTELPREVCLMPLEVLLLSDNQLTALPKEIGKMAVLAELDVAHNRLAQVPLSVGELDALRALDLSDNQLGLLPLQITYLKLETLDVSSNCISSLPLELRHMSSLVSLRLDNNPLVSPPTTVCMRGRVHIFKYLECLENKDSSTMRRGTAAKHASYTSSTPVPLHAPAAPANATADCVRHRTRHVDADRERRASNDAVTDGASGAHLTGSIFESCSSGRSTPSTPSTLSPGAALSLSRAHSLSSESPLSGLRTSPDAPLSHGDDKSKLSHQQTYRQYKEALRQQRQQDVYRPRDQPSPPHSSPHSPLHRPHSASTPHSPVNGHSARGVSSSTPASAPAPLDQAPGSPLLHSTPRRLQTAIPQNINGNSLPETTYKTEENKRPVQKVVPSRNVNRMNLTNGNVEYQNGRIPTSGSLPRMRSATSPDAEPYAKPVSPSKSPTFPVPPNVRSGIPSRTNANGDAKLLTTTVSYLKGANTKPAGASARLAWNKDVPPDKLSFTMKREFDKQKEESELLQQLRTIIESRLKMSLPEDLAPVLADGVVLCHLANHVRPRSVASVHVPSVAQPKLTMARCRRNVDNFLEACRKIGVEEEDMCSPDDILSEGDEDARSVAPLARTVVALLAHATPPPHPPPPPPLRPTYTQLRIQTDLEHYAEETRECRIDYFHRRTFRNRYAEDRIIGNFNYVDRSGYVIDETDEYQLNLQNNNRNGAYDSLYKPYICERDQYDCDNNDKKNMNGRVQPVSPYWERGRDEADGGASGTYVRARMSLDLRDNLNAAPTSVEGDLLVTCLCLGGFLFTALFLYLCPLQ